MEQKLSQKSMSAYAYAQVKNMIFTRELKAGDHIPEERIAEFVGGSRTPVREALRMLAAEGLVEILPRRYAAVAMYNDQTISEIGTVRLMQDLLAARLAIQYGTNQEFIDMRPLVEKCEQCALAGDISGSVAADDEFHMCITKTGKNHILIENQKKVYQIIRFIQISRGTDPNRMFGQVRHHSDILLRLFERDYPRACNAICDHLQDYYHINPEIVNSYRQKVKD